MALDGSYAGLKASIADWLNRGDLAGAIPDFIALAESQLSRRLLQDGPVREMLGRSDATVAAEFVALPADFLGVRALYLAGTVTPLEFFEPEKIVERKIANPMASGDPVAYSIVGGELQFWPWAAGNQAPYAAELSYWKRVPALSDAAPSNWLLAAHPDAYLYTALLQAAPYLKDDDRIAVWGQYATQIAADIAAAGRIARTAPQLGVPYRPGTTP